MVAHALNPRYSEEVEVGGRQISVSLVYIARFRSSLDTQ